MHVLVEKIIFVLYLKHDFIRVAFNMSVWENTCIYTFNYAFTQTYLNYDPDSGTNTHLVFLWRKRIFCCNFPL